VGGEHGHHHAPTGTTDRRALAAALALILALMAGEVSAGLVARSLALLSDAAHLLTDAAALVLALVAVRLAVRPPRGGYTYGLRRAEILSAQANGLTLLLLAVWLAVEAVRRLVHPPVVRGGLVLATALAGAVVNVAATWLISRADRRSLNIQGALQHIVTDLYAFLATALAGLVMLLTGFGRADGIATLLVAALMVRSAVKLLWASGRILLEAAPPGLDPRRLGAALAGVAGVREVHDLHVWQIGTDQPALSAHVLVSDDRNCHDTRRALEDLLHDGYGIRHTTLQVDHAGGDLFQIGYPPGQQRPTD
jgi:cobalt-zinc-cadmium efflux system protein